LSQVKTYQGSRLKLGLSVLVIAALAGSGTLFVREQPLLGWIIILLFGALALFMLAAAVAGVSLRLGHKGFEVGSIFKRQRVRWDEIEPLQIGQVGRSRSRVIAVKYASGRSSNSVLRAMTGRDLAIGNLYGVPLEVLCDTMNEYRSEYLAEISGQGTAARRPAAFASSSTHDVATAAVPARAARPVLLGFCGALLVLILNVLLRLKLHLSGATVSGGIGAAAGICALTWFLKWVRRPPTPGERWTFMFTYGALIVLPYLGLLLWGSARRGVNLPAFLLLALHCVVYLATTQFFVSEKRFTAMMSTRV
jgi:hypothetical protein